MTAKDKAIKVIREIRKLENDAYNKKSFCYDHKFTLEAMKYNEIESQLRKACQIIQNEFETGYVSSEINDEL